MFTLQLIFDQFSTLASIYLYILWANNVFLTIGVNAHNFYQINLSEHSYPHSHGIKGLNTTKCLQYTTRYTTKIKIFLYFTAAIINVIHKKWILLEIKNISFLTFIYLSLSVRKCCLYTWNFKTISSSCTIGKRGKNITEKILFTHYFWSFILLMLFDWFTILVWVAFP